MLLAIEMVWKILCLAAILSVEAQRFKLNSGVKGRVGTEITKISDVRAYQTAIDYRLPNNTRPELYLINLNFGDFHEDDLSFSGKVEITIRVIDNTDTITLHSSVAVFETALTTFDGGLISFTVEYDALREFMIIKSSVILLQDSIVRLTVSYGGRIGTSISGVYRGSYLHNENEKR